MRLEPTTTEAETIVRQFICPYCDTVIIKPSDDRVVRVGEEFECPNDVCSGEWRAVVSEIEAKATVIPHTCTFCGSVDIESERPEGEFTIYNWCNECEEEWETIATSFPAGEVDD